MGTCKWILYDNRTICPEGHVDVCDGSVEKPFWRLPEQYKKVIKFCPYCGKQIDFSEIDKKSKIENKDMRDVKIMMKTYSGGIDAEMFVIKIFDAIKCAAATGNTLNIWLDRKEVQELAEHIKAVNWIEINEETKEDGN